MPTSIPEVIPAAAVVLVVGMFIKYLISREKAHARIADECHAIQKESLDVIRQNSEAFGMNSGLLKQVHEILVSRNGKAKKSSAKPRHRKSRR